MIRVLVADDSPTVREVIRLLLAETSDVMVVGEAVDGVAAVDLAAGLRPDVVTMDVTMPRLDGLQATAAIMAQAPTRVLIVCDTGQAGQMSLSFRAMQAGALELIPKPTRGEPLDAWGKRLVEAIRLMAHVPVVRRRRVLGEARREAPAPQQGAPEVIGIVASTGGPPVLASLLGALPKDGMPPILVAQHMASGFARGLVRWLDAETRLRVTLADDAAVLRPGHVYLPPDGCDIELGSGDRVFTPPSAGPYQPSGDRLLASLAAVAGACSAGVVLTGMGEDGARGLLAIRRAGGLTVAQDAESSVVFGMPGAAARLGAVERLSSPERIVASLLSLARPAPAETAPRRRGRNPEGG